MTDHDYNTILATVEVTVARGNDAPPEGWDALASAPPSAPEPEVHSYDPTDQRQSVTIRWPDGKCLGYVLDRTRYTDNLPTAETSESHHEGA